VGTLIIVFRSTQCGAASRALEQLHSQFRGLDWVDFLTDLYLVLEALGSQAVEQVVPVVDWFGQVGASSQQLCAVLSQRKDELLSELAA